MVLLFGECDIRWASPYYRMKRRGRLARFIVSFILINSLPVISNEQDGAEPETFSDHQTKNPEAPEVYPLEAPEEYASHENENIPPPLPPSRDLLHNDGDASSRTQRPNKLDFGNDVGHIREHLISQYGFGDKQAAEYLEKHDVQTQFFIMHDFDRNHKLDGLELMNALMHDNHHEHDMEEEEEAHHKDNEADMKSIEDLVDLLLTQQDLNNDGYIDYPEYIEYYKE